MELFRSKVACQQVINIALWGLFLGVVLVGCKTKKDSDEKLPFYNSADFTAEWIDKNDSKYWTIHQVSEFSMHDQNGNVFNNDSLKGKIYVANFFFTTCPTICPKMVNNLAVLQEKFAHENSLCLISFSVTPWIDSVARLKKYGKEHHINPQKWHLLTGEKQKTYALGRKSFFAEKKEGLKKDSTEFLHTESMFLIDKNARIRGVYNATQRGDIDRIFDDIKLLLKEN